MAHVPDVAVLQALSPRAQSLLDRLVKFVEVRAASLSLIAARPARALSTRAHARFPPQSAVCFCRRNASRRRKSLRRSTTRAPTAGRCVAKEDGRRVRGIGKEREGDKDLHPAWMPCCARPRRVLAHTARVLWAPSPVLRVSFARPCPHCARPSRTLARPARPYLCLSVLRTHAPLVPPCARVVIRRPSSLRRSSGAPRSSASGTSSSRRSTPRAPVLPRCVDARPDGTGLSCVAG